MQLGQIDFKVQISFQALHVVHLPYLTNCYIQAASFWNLPDFSSFAFLLAHVDHVLKGLVKVIADPGKKGKS